MSWNDFPPPAGWVLVSNPRHGNMLLESDPLTFSLSAANAVAYEVRNYYGSIVDQGSVSGTTLSLLPLPLGWYRLYLYQAGSDANYGSVIGAAMFSVIRADSRMVTPPSPPQIGGTDYDFSAQDHVLRGITLCFPFRYSIEHAADLNGPYPATLDRALTDFPYRHNWYDQAHLDPVRPRPSFLAFPNGTWGTGDLAGVTTTVATTYPDIQYFEGPTNEPDMADPATITRMHNFRDAVKAGHPDAKVMGPNPVSVNGSLIGDLDTFIANGGMTGLDAFSFHFYNCANGDITMGRRTLTSLRAVLSKYGLSGIEKWQTEWGAFAATYGVYNVRRQARWAMIHLFLMDQFGVPKERNAYYYEGEHGFWDFPSFMKVYYGWDHSSVMPAMAMYRVFSQEVFGKAWDSELDFGTVGNDLYIGSRYVNPNDGSAVMSFLSDGVAGSVGVHVTGADSLEVVGSFGAVKALAADAQGLVTIPVDQEPVYARVPTGVSATVERLFYGPDLARTAIGSGSGDLPSKPLNGVLENAYYSGSSPAEYRDPSGLPTTFTATWDTPQEGDTIMVFCPTPWQQQGSLLDFDVGYQDVDGVWHTVETFTEDPLTFRSLTPTQQGRCLYESYYSGRSVWIVEMAARVTAKAIRIYVRDTTAGGEATDEANAAGGQGWGPKKLTLQELSFYSRQPKPRRRTFPARVAI